MELDKTIGYYEEWIWELEGKIETEPDPDVRNGWVQDLAGADQELAELREFCC